MNTYNSLRSGSRGRMAEMRRYVDRWNNDSRHTVKLASWRDARRHGVAKISAGKSDGRVTGNFAWGRECLHAESGYFDHMREATSEMLPRGFPTYWYTDTDCCETVHGVVVMLPHGRFMAYVKWSGCDGVSALAEVFDSARDAARAIDSLAERIGEEEREHNAKWHEACGLEQANSYAHEQMRAIRGKVKRRVAVIRELHTQENIDTMCGQVSDLREDFAGILAEVIERKQRLAELKA